MVPIRNLSAKTRREAEKKSGPEVLIGTLLDAIHVYGHADQNDLLLKKCNKIYIFRNKS
ncbi:MAG: hypothetical protein MJK14_19880 [Rivularia sp. ALOHA_DT_140]|nr:hypothetical protein [Rivularia sp. ALOHA_DT_140]